MIHAHFGIAHDPFTTAPELLAHQREVFEVLRVHCRQGGLCIVAGEPGTGKTLLKETLKAHDPKGLLPPHIGRTLHTYHNTLRILCQSFGADFDGSDHKCEKRLIEEAHRLYRKGQALAVLIDDAHLMDLHCLRKLRLLTGEFPKNHNLVLFAQTELLARLALGVNEDLRSRVTYSTLLPKLEPEDIQRFILDQFDRCGLPHTALGEAALALIARSSDGILRHAKTLTIAALIHAVRAQKRTADTQEVNAALMQPHWRTQEHWLQAPASTPAPGKPAQAQ